MSHRLSIYPEGKLGAHAETFPGYAFESERFTNNPNDVPLVKGENVQQGYIDWAASKFWPANDVHSLEKFILRSGDIVLAMDRPWVTAGLKWAAIKPHDTKSLLVQRVARLRAKPTLDQAFLRCLISSSYFSNYIQPIVTGVNVPHISGKQIGDFRIPIPDLPTQRKIAAVLAAYDDLIEANRRRIALLEKMAEEIYREWFVRLRFPGHATTKITKGIPDGWSRTRVSNLACYLKRGVAPAYDDKAEGIAINQKCIRNGRIDLEHARRQSREVGADRMIQLGDILVNSTGEGTLGRVAQVTSAIPKCIVDSHVTIVRPAQGVPARFLGLTLQAWEPHFSTMGRGSTNQTELAPATIGRVGLLVPSSEIATKFEELANPIANQVGNLSEQNVHLTRTRDLLLPRLISGKLSVESLDIAFPPSMAEA